MTETERMRARNLAFFEGYAPTLAAQLKAHTPRTTLAAVSGGGWDIRVGQQSLYAGGYAHALGLQLENFRASGAQRFLAPPEPGRFDAYAERLLARVRRDAEAAGLAFSDHPVRPDCHFLFAMGVGLAGHFLDLCEISGCRALHVFDIDAEMLHHSLATTDWAQLISDLSARGVTLGMTVNADPMTLAHAAVTTAKLHDPTAADGFMFFVQRPEPALLGTVHLIEREMGARYGDVGHFYDEMLMLKNAHANLSGGARIFDSSVAPAAGVPVFVVGSGPSLDDAMDDLKRCRDGAIVISCGSALRALLAAGVRPDFQIEIENILVRQTLTQLAAEFGLDGIVLAGAVSVEAAAAEMFENRIFFQRRHLVTYPFLANGSSECLHHTDPTVGNAGVAFGLALRPSTLYLFGLDLGVRVGAERHHAKDSYHYTDDDNLKAAPQDLIFDIEGPANFGGAARSSRGLHTARFGVEAAVSEAIADDGVPIFNCSDGVQIAMAAPKRPSELVAAPGTFDMDGFLRSFPAIDGRAIRDRWRGDELAAAIAGVAAALTDAVRDAPGFLDHAFLNRMMAVLKPGMTPEDAIGDRIPASAVWSLRGTLYMFLIVVRYLAMRQTEGRPEEFTEIARAALIDGIAELEGVARAALTDPSTPLSEADLPTIWSPTVQA